MSSRATRRRRRPQSLPAGRTQLARPTACTMKPSRRAALASRSSRVTMFSEAGSPSEAMTAAASCSESAPRSGCTRRSRRAMPRRVTVGCTSFQVSARRSRRSSAVVTAPSVNAPSRSSLERADAHSTSVAHQTHITGSCAALASNPSVLASVTISGTIARAIPEPQRPSRLSSISVATALAAACGLGGLVLSSSVAGGLRAARTAPARSSRATLPSASGEALIADSSRATGVPRSMISTDSPVRT